MNTSLSPLATQAVPKSGISAGPHLVYDYRSPLLRLSFTPRLGFQAKRDEFSSNGASSFGLGIQLQEENRVAQSTSSVSSTTERDCEESEAGYSHTTKAYPFPPSCAFTPRLYAAFSPYPASGFVPVTLPSFGTPDMAVLCADINMYQLAVSSRTPSLSINTSEIFAECLHTIVPFLDGSNGDNVVQDAESIRDQVKIASGETEMDVDDGDEADPMPSSSMRGGKISSSLFSETAHRQSPCCGPSIQEPVSFLLHPSPATPYNGTVLSNTSDPWNHQYTPPSAPAQEATFFVLRQSTLVPKRSADYIAMPLATHFTNMPSYLPNSWQATQSGLALPRSNDIQIPPTNQHKHPVPPPPVIVEAPTGQPMKLKRKRVSALAFTQEVIVPNIRTKVKAGAIQDSAFSESWSPVLNAHAGVSPATLISMADKYKRRMLKLDDDAYVKGAYVEFDKTWLMQFAGKLTARGEMVDYFRCYLEGCNQTNKRRDHILVHVGSHVDQRPFACSFCDLRFFRKNECKRHEGSHTGYRPYVCEICPSNTPNTFVRADLLRRHLQRAHGDVKRLDDQEEGGDTEDHVQPPMLKRRKTA